MFTASELVVGKKGSTKDLIVTLLSHEWPLTAKEIFSRVSKESGTGISYQAVHKVLRDLGDRGVLAKEGNSFGLDKVWLQSQKAFFEQTSADYLNLKDRYDMDSNFKGTVKMHFNDYTKFAVTLATMFKNRTIVGDNLRPGLGIIRHAYWPLRFSFDDFTLLKDMIHNSAGGYAFVRTDSPLDRWIIKQYLKSGFNKAVIIPKFATMKDDLVIHGDGIMQIKFSPETTATLDEIYSKIENLTSLFKEFVEHTFSKRKVSIDVTITKNPALAKTLEAYFLSYLDGDRGAQK